MNTSPWASGSVPGSWGRRSQGPTARASGRRRLRTRAAGRRQPGLGGRRGGQGHPQQSKRAQVRKVASRSENRTGQRAGAWVAPSHEA